MLRTIGADLVGMSTALEAIAAREAGAEVLGISLVTNLAAGMTGEPLNHLEVLAPGSARPSRMGALLAAAPRRSCDPTTASAAIAPGWPRIPIPTPAAELTALLRRARRRDAELADRFGAHAGVRHRRPARRARRRAEPDEPGRGRCVPPPGSRRYLRGTGGDLVVIGYDARHKSELFAHDTAAVMAGAGIRALLLPRALPTPVLAYAIRHLGASAGVMVTASHNPARDNGYKVYLGDGGQIVPPADAEISAAHRRRRGAGRRIPRRDDWETARTTRSSTPTSTPLRRSRCSARLPARDLKIAYTPMHGVGARGLPRGACTRPASPAISVVAAQAEPDPDFPTVAFPNPEEPGAIDLALELARSIDADIVIANDPDADRCAVAVPDASADGGWRMLRGDEVGVLLADFLLTNGISGRYATSIVSSSALSAMAERHADAVLGDPDRLQVDREDRRAGVRLRGSARLSRRAEPRARQGRHQRGRVHRGLDGGDTARRRAEPCSSGSTRSGASTASTPLTRSPCGSTTSPRSARRSNGCGRRHRRRSAACPSCLPKTSPAGASGLPPTDGLRYRLDGSARGSARAG